MNAQEILNNIINGKTAYEIYCIGNGDEVDIETENGDVFEFECQTIAHRYKSNGWREMGYAPYDDFDVERVHIDFAAFNCEPLELDDTLRKDAEEMLRYEIEAYVNENGYEDYD